jgi:hypothetical protein
MHQLLCHGAYEPDPGRSSAQLGISHVRIEPGV